VASGIAVSEAERSSGHHKR